MEKDNRQLEIDRKEFYSYDSSWEHTFFDETTGGFLVTQLARKYKDKNKNEEEIFRKEQEMGMKYASFGFQIEHLYETPGVSSPDVAIHRHGISVRINGVMADLKRLSSSNNIYKEGKDARYKKGADLILFEFTWHFSGALRSLELLSKKGIHGYYYYSNEFKCYSF